jgi:hypothetical protein
MCVSIESNEKKKRRNRCWSWEKMTLPWQHVRNKHIHHVNFKGASVRLKAGNARQSVVFQSGKQCVKLAWKQGRSVCRVGKGQAWIELDGRCCRIMVGIVKDIAMNVAHYEDCRSIIVSRAHDWKKQCAVGQQWAAAPTACR